jgi:signal peptidase I
MQSQADSASYIINEDCYFMLGDNRDFSVDSRHFGFVPKSCVTGVAVSIIVLKGQKGTRWNKIFKDFE